MRLEKYKSMVGGVSAERSAWRIVAIGMLIGNLLLILAVIGKEERTIITPPALSKAFWVSGGNASPEYLEQMALWFASLALNISPANVDYSNEVFMRYVVPDSHGRMKSVMAAQSGRIKRNNASQTFYLSRYKIDPDKMQVALSGKLKKWVGETAVPAEEKTFRIRFRMESGRILVSEFKEAKWDDPFNEKVDPDNSDVAVR